MAGSRSVIRIILGLLVAGAPLGDGTGVDALTPVAVAGGIKFRSLAGKGVSMCGVSREDQIYCWGWNYNGGLGLGTKTYYEMTPKLVVVP